MARPREYDESSRVHMGTRFDKEIIYAFDALCKSKHMSRTQAVECLITNAIKNQHIPPFIEVRLNSREAPVPVYDPPVGKPAPTSSETSRKGRAVRSR